MPIRTRYLPDAGFNEREDVFLCRCHSCNEEWIRRFQFDGLCPDQQEIELLLEDEHICPPFTPIVTVTRGRLEVKL